MASLTKPHPQAVKALLTSSESVTLNDINRIWNDCLESMLTLYLPPHRDPNEEEMKAACATSLQDYMEDLVEFSSETLRAGWRDIRRTHKRLGWPLIGEIRSSCISYERSSSRSAQPRGNVIEELHKRASEIDRLAREYTNRYMRSELGSEAKEEGWHFRLKDYVWREAHLQAQRIVRTGEGSVDVSIPGELIDEWKRAG